MDSVPEAIKAAHARGDYDDVSEALRAAHARGDYDGQPEAMRAAWARGDFEGLSEAMRAAWARGDFEGLSEAIKAAWAQGVYGEEWRRKNSEATKAQRERGDFDDMYTEECLRKMSEGVQAAWERGCFDGVFQSPTSIEIQIAAALDIMGIEHQTQYRPEGYSRIYDEFIPPNTLIEVQGDYWHGPKRPEQQKRDAEKARWATDNGYEFMVIWEHEIKGRGAWPIIAEAFA